LRANNRSAGGAIFTVEFSSGIRGIRCGELNTVLVLTADEALRGRIARSLSKFSTFEARSESEAYQTLRRIDIDVVLREGKGPAGALAAFVTAAKDIAPRTLVVAIGDLTDDEISADFSVPEAFTARELDAVLRHALDRQRLIREVDAARGLTPGARDQRGGRSRPGTARH
jgi:hypothetical protein